MAKVEFHFDFGSPNAYLAHLVIPQIEQQAPSALDVSGIELRQDLVVARLDDRRTGNAHGVYLYKTRSSDGDVSDFRHCPPKS